MCIPKDHVHYDDLCVVVNIILERQILQTDGNIQKNEYLTGK